MLLVLGTQAAALPPPYPRAGVTKLLDNARIQVWDIAWLKQSYPLHRHVYDLVGVYYSPGDRIITSKTGDRRAVSSAAWNTVFQRRGLEHIEEGTSEPPLRAVFIEIKDEPRPDASKMDGTALFPASTAKALVDNDRVTIWEFAPAPATGPTAHRHHHDAVIVSF